jgi:hypothetical protein
MNFEETPIYFVLPEGRQAEEGPFTLREIWAKVECGLLRASDLFAVKGMEKWSPVSELPRIKRSEPDGPLKRERFERFTPPPSEYERPPGFVVCGAVLMGAAVLGVIYFWWWFSITPPGTDAINFGLLSDRQNGIIASGALGIVGAILFAAGLVLEQIKGGQGCPRSNN